MLFCSAPARLFWCLYIWNWDVVHLGLKERKSVLNCYYEIRNTFLGLQEWNPDATQVVAKKEKPKKNEAGNASSAGSGGEAAAQSGDRGR